jgi:hypothetical protein
VPPFKYGQCAQRSVKPRPAGLSQLSFASQQQGSRPRLKCGVETGGALVGENVTIKLDIQFIKA